MGTKPSSVPSAGWELGKQDVSHQKANPYHYLHNPLPTTMPLLEGHLVNTRWALIKFSALATDQVHTLGSQFSHLWSECVYNCSVKSSFGKSKWRNRTLTWWGFCLFVSLFWSSCFLAIGNGPPIPMSHYIQTSNLMLGYFHKCLPRDLGQIIHSHL